MAKSYFLTGTDTEVGKSFVIQLLLKSLRRGGVQALGLKPIASDSYVSEESKGGSESALVNEDALGIYHANDKTLSYSAINPFVFAPAIAPHIAAAEVGVELSVAELERQVITPDAELVLIEGAGGWLTPLNSHETYADWVEAKQIPVILVIGMKLGCLNHAQLTLAEIESRGLKVAGWIANKLDPQMANFDENLSWLKCNIKAPLLAMIDYQQDALPDEQLENLKSKLT